MAYNHVGGKLSNKIKVKVKDFNDVAKKHYDLAKQLRRGHIILVCNDCNSEVEEQRHVDDSKHPHKRQVICSNEKCGKIDYRYQSDG